MLLKEPGGTGIEFGGLRILCKLINLLPVISKEGTVDAGHGEGG